MAFDKGQSSKEILKQLNEDKEANKVLIQLFKKIETFVKKYKIQCEYAAHSNTDKQSISIMNIRMPKTLIKYLVAKATLKQRKSGQKSGGKLSPSRLLGALMAHEDFEVTFVNDILTLPIDKQ